MHFTEFMRDPPREDAALVGRDFDQAEFETHPLLRAQPPILLTAFGTIGTNI
jgi:hypothetical protein